MRIITFLWALLVAFLHLSFALIMAIGFVVVVIPSVVVRHSLKL